MAAREVSDFATDDALPVDLLVGFGVLAWVLLSALPSVVRVRRAWLGGQGTCDTAC